MGPPAFQSVELPVNRCVEVSRRSLIKVPEVLMYRTGAIDLSSVGKTARGLVNAPDSHNYRFLGGHRRN